MKRTVASFLTLSLLAVAAAASAAPRIAQSPAEIKAPALAAFTIPDPERVVLPNGLTLFLLENHEVPLIQLSGRVRVGGRLEPPNQLGLASICGAVLRTGGTAKLSGDEIDHKLEAIGASIETSIDVDAGTISASALKEDWETVLPILADILMRPAFAPEKMELAKLQEKTAISRRNDTPGDIAEREIAKLVYGPESPFARHPEYATLAAVSRDDLLAFHRRYFHPNRVILGITGDFEKEALVRSVTAAFAEWPAGEVEAPALAATREKAPGGISLAPKEGVTQTAVRIAHLGTRYDDSDFYALRIASNIFGVGWSSRLMTRVREKMGLAYSVFAFYGVEWDRPGLFFVTLETKTETTAEALAAVRAELDALRAGPIAEDEVRLAKDRILNAFIFNFDSPEKIVSQVVTLASVDYPLDWYKRYRTQLEKVTRADVERVVRERIRPEELTTLLVADRAAIQGELSGLGEVREIDLTIPSAPGEEVAGGK